MNWMTGGSASRRDVLGMLFVLLCTGVARADRIDDGGGNFTFDIAAPNPYTSSLTATGGAYVAFDADAQQVVNLGSWATRVNSDGYTVTLNGGSVMHNQLSTGLYVGANATINNSGTVQSDLGTAIYSTFTTSTTNTAGGTIDGGTFAIYQTGAGIVDNAGLIQSTGGTGVYVATSPSVSFLNRNGATINAHVGVSFDSAPSSWINQGQITGANASSIGVAVANGGGFSNETTGQIDGGDDGGYGVYVTGGDTSISNLGSIQGDYGIYAMSTTTVTNHAGASIEGVDEYAVDLQGAGSLNNSGMVDGHDGHGVRQNLGGTLSNWTGASIAADGNAVAGPTTVNNRGMIQSRTGMNYGVLMNNGGTLTNYAGGSILSNGTGIRGADHVHNYGSIQMPGNSWTAIQTSANNNSSVTLYTGSSLLGAITDLGGTGDTLNLRGSGAGTFDQGLVGFEKIIKRDSGTWTMPAGHGLTVTFFQVEAGTLIANGTYTSSLCSVYNNATLKGTGTFNGTGAVNIDSTATLAPGNSIGQMTVNRDLWFGPNATLEIEVNVGASDSIVVDGVVTLNGTLSVVDLSGGTIAGGTQYNIISATGGFTGSFDQIVDDSAVLDFVVDQNGPFLRLTGYLERTYRDVADTGNRRAIGGVLDEARGAAQLATLTGELDALDDAELNQAMQSLAPGAAASMIFTTQRNTEQFAINLGRQARASRNGSLAMTSTDHTGFGLPGRTLLAMTGQDPQLLAYAMQQTDAEADAPAGEASPQADPAQSRWNLFVMPFGQVGQVDSSSQRVGYDHWSTGLTAGLDYRLNGQWVVGVCGAYQYSRADFDDGLGEGTLHSGRIGPYVNWTRGPWQLDASVTGGYHWYDNDRHVMVGGFDRTATSEHEGFDISAFAQLAHDCQLGAWTLTPSIAVQYIHLEEDGYTETGAGPANLVVDDSDHDALRSVVGARLWRTVEANGLQLVPELWAGWAFEWLDNEPELTSRFVSGPATSFTTISDTAGRHSALIGAGVTALINARTSIYGKHETEWTDVARTHSFWVGVEHRF